jgi:hypothetical protein
LVLLAALIWAVASFTAFHIYAKARDSQGGKRLGWVFLTGVATGAGIWATHFVAMLAFKTGPACRLRSRAHFGFLIDCHFRHRGWLLYRGTGEKPRCYPRLAGW